MHIDEPSLRADPESSELSGLSAVRAAALIAAKRLSSVEFVRTCLDRVALRDPVVRAFAHIDADRVLGEAAECDATPSIGPLHGVPIAVKDVIDVAGMPSGMGSAIYDGFAPRFDAACVSILRSAGAVILGKTVTAEFAGVSAGLTTNPLDSTRTPGGSSSGSAAAVADRMVALALGTQTGGSIVRPASFCGVIGFKPSFGTVNRSGLKFAAEGLDTIGVLARDIDDVALSWSLLVARDPQTPLPVAFAPRLLLYRGHHWSRATSDTVSAVEDVAERLSAVGAAVVELPPPDGIEQLSQARIIINAYERAHALAPEWRQHSGQISPQMAQVLARGWSVSLDEYRGAIATAETWRKWFADAMHGCHGILTASVNGEAPVGLASTGDASFQEIWTILHLPSISLPLCRGRSGLPVGVQLVGHRLADDALLGLSKWVISQTIGRTVPREPQ